MPPTQTSPTWALSEAVSPTTLAPEPIFVCVRPSPLWPTRAFAVEWPSAPKPAPLAYAFASTLVAVSAAATTFPAAATAELFPTATVVS